MHERARVYPQRFLEIVNRVLRLPVLQRCSTGFGETQGSRFARRTSPADRAGERAVRLGCIRLLFRIARALIDGDCASSRYPGAAEAPVQIVIVKDNDFTVCIAADFESARRRFQQEEEKNCYDEKK